MRSISQLCSLHKTAKGMTHNSTTNADHFSASVHQPSTLVVSITPIELGVFCLLRCRLHLHSLSPLLLLVGFLTLQRLSCTLNSAACLYVGHELQPTAEAPKEGLRQGKVREGGWREAESQASKPDGMERTTARWGCAPQVANTALGAQTCTMEAITQLHNTQTTDRFVSRFTLH